MAIDKLAEYRKRRLEETYISYFICYSEDGTFHNVVSFLHPVEWLAAQRRIGNDAVIHFWAHVSATLREYKDWRKAGVVFCGRPI